MPSEGMGSAKASPPCRPLSWWWQLFHTHLVQFLGDGERLSQGRREEDGCEGSCRFL